MDELVENEMMRQELFIFKRNFTAIVKRAIGIVEKEQKLQPYVEGGV